MPALTSSRRIAFIAAALLAANITPTAALAATAIGHASVTILPTTAAVSETTPIELDSVGNRISTRPGIVTLTHDGGRAPTLNGNGQLTLAIATTVKKGAAQPQGAYSGSYTVIVNY
jgi:hypothetical protein